MGEKDKKSALDDAADDKEINKVGMENDQIQNEENSEAVAEENISAEQKTANELNEKINELNDKYLRLYSEFDNYRKRTSKERIELFKTAGEETLKSLLPVLDDFERAIKFNDTTTDIKLVNEGVNLIYNKFNNTLSQKGITPMESVGKVFNVDEHEAITNIPAPSEDLKGKVVEEVEKGYLLNGKVIRFAKVIVGN